MSLGLPSLRAVYRRLNVHVHVTADAQMAKIESLARGGTDEVIGTWPGGGIERIDLALPC